MHVLLAPDKFKGSLGAPRVAEAMADGVRRADPTAEIESCPVADGGDGTVEALQAAIGGKAVAVSVTGPLGKPVDASIVVLGDGRVALEMAAASGLALLGRRRDALRASSRGTGELMRHALERARGEAVLVAIGGSASTDGGTGAAAAWGWRFLDGRGRPLEPGGGALHRLERIEPGDRPRPGVITGLSDVDNPLLGRRGAARVFGPQKGAGAREVEVLERGLERLAETIRRELGVDVASVPGAGAAGGMGAGLVAFFSASLEPGFDAVAQVVGLPAAVGRADLVITGEGHLDEQSLAGKATIGVARTARGCGVPCVAVAGRVTLDDQRLGEAGISAARALVDEVGEARALQQPQAAIASATATLVSGLRGSGARR